MAFEQAVVFFAVFAFFFLRFLVDEESRGRISSMPGRRAGSAECASSPPSSPSRLSRSSPPLQRGDAGVPIRRGGGRNHVDFGHSLDARARVRQHAARRPPRVAGRRRESLAGVRSERPDGAVAHHRTASWPALHASLHARRASQRDGGLHHRARTNGGPARPVRDLRRRRCDPGESGAAVFNRFQIYARMAAERNDFNINLGDTIYSDSGVAGPPARTAPRSGRSTGSASRSRPSGGSGRRPASTATGTITSSSTTSPARAWRGDLRRRGTGLPGLLARRVQSREWSLSQCPLGEAPRALLPRLALVPEREGHDELR